MNLLSTDLPNGYQLRPASMADTTAIVALIQASKQAAMGNFAPTTTVESYLSLLGWPNFDAEEDRRVVSSAEGEIVGYGHVINRQSYLTNNAEIHVHPNHYSRGIGTRLTAWAEARARQFITLAPAGREITLGCALVPPDQPAQNILIQQGFQFVRHFWSLRIELTDLLTPQWPSGIAVRHTITGEDEVLLYRAIDETFRDHWGYVSVPFDEGFRRFLQRDIHNNPSYDPTLWFIATEDREIAGYALCRTLPGQHSLIAYIDKVGVRAPWRQRGVGLALLQHSFATFWQRGIGEVRLEVDADSLTGATRLYEKAGMQIYLQKKVYQKLLRTGDPE